MQLFYNNLKTPIIELPEANQVDHPSRSRTGSLNLPFNRSLPTMTRVDQLRLLNQPSLGSAYWLSKSTGSLTAVDSFRCANEKGGCKKVFLEKVGASSHALFNCPFSPKSTVAQHQALLQHPFQFRLSCSTFPVGCALLIVEFSLFFQNFGYDILPIIFGSFSQSISRK